MMRAKPRQHNAQQKKKENEKKIYNKRPNIVNDDEIKLQFDVL